jgi:multidrug efflux pump subunit AcrA (membrane-fusion protein)
MKTDLTTTIQKPGRTGSSVGMLSGEVMRIVVPLAILLAGVLGFVALRAMKAKPASTERPSPVPLVETVLTRSHEGGLTFSVDGLVVPYREINLSAESAGRVAVKADACRAGTFVTRGTPLITIDGRDYELEVKRLERELAQSNVSIEELDVEVANSQSLVELAREQLTLQRKELERIETLAGKGFSTTSELDRTKRDELAVMNSVMTLDNQTALLNTRRNRLESARDLCQSQLERAELDLARTKVVSPIDGVVVEEMVEEDSYVQKGASLLKLEDTSAVEVRCNLRMDQLLWLWSQLPKRDAEESSREQRDYQIPPAPVTVSYELAGKHFEWTGVLSRFDGIGVDERTRTVPCRALVSNPREVRVTTPDGQPAASPAGPPALVRGMYVTVSVQARAGSPLLEIPESAVRPGNKVWEVVDGRLAIRRVRVAHTGDEMVLIHSDGSDLEPGAKLISSPLAQADEGMPVKEHAVE